jgi:hypothetical protein
MLVNALEKREGELEDALSLHSIVTGKRKERKGVIGLE